MKKAVRLVGALVGVGALVSALYGSYLYADYWRFNQKTAELPGLHLYPVQESRATHAYSWYASYPKIDEPVFDRTVSKIVNDAKAAFLARVNFQAKTTYPQDDLNVSFELEKYDDRQLSVTITNSQVLKNNDTKTSTLITYDRSAKRIVEMRQVKASSKQPKASTAKGEPTHTKSDCSKSKCVALTFNGGPNYVTPKILDTLKAYKAKATFFEVGAQAKLYPSIAKRTVREGHVVGTMGENHRNLLAAPIEDAEQNLQKGSELIRSVTGKTPQLARAPYGAMTGKLAKKLAAPFIGWNVASPDDADASQIYDTIMMQVHPGAIVMSSDTREEMANAYTRVIPDLIKQGYELVTVPQLLGDDGTKPGLQNGR